MQQEQQRTNITNVAESSSKTSEPQLNQNRPSGGTAECLGMVSQAETGQGCYLLYTNADSKF